MVNGRAISPDIRRMIIRLSYRLTKEDLSVYTGLSVRSVEHILSHFRKYGSIQAPKKRETRQRALAKDDVAVSAFPSFLLQT
jgi:CRP-like cAMP-binding protein